MEIRVRYEDGKAFAMLIQNPNEEYSINYDEAVAACLAELNSLLDSISKVKINED